MRSRVFCFGDAALDNIVPIEALPSPEYAAMFYTESFYIGGTICNTAVDLASWGVPTTLATAYDLGFDEYGDRLIDLLQAFPALDLSRIARRQDTHTPYCRLLVTPDGERSMLGFRPRQEPDRHLSPEMVSDEQIIVANASVDVRHLDAFHALRARGVLTVSGDIINPAHPDLPAVAVAINSAGMI
ncbi:MAG: hypothetical protein IT326_09015, partial [Anaerolineae bacterium]|nr:hypothetical protein [Anaerolineae bacterium]